MGPEPSPAEAMPAMQPIVPTTAQIKAILLRILPSLASFCRVWAVFIGNSFSV